MHYDFKNDKWELTTFKKDTKILENFLGWLKPLTELSTPIQGEAEEARIAVEVIQAYLETNALPTTEES